MNDLSHMRKEDKFIPIVTVVIYYGEHPWDGARDLHGVLNIPDEIKPFVGNYPMNLVEVVNNHLQFRNADNRDLFQLLNLVYNTSLNKAERIQTATAYEKEHNIDEDVIHVLAATNNINLEKINRKEDFRMGTLFEEIARDSRLEGRIEGRIEERAIAIIELLEDINEPSDSLKKLIMEQKDVDILRRWHKLAAKASSIESFEQKIGLAHLK